MTKIFIEAKNNKTSEYHFIQTILNIFFPKMEVEFNTDELIICIMKRFLTK